MLSGVLELDVIITITKYIFLRSNKNKSKSRTEDEESEGLALLIPDIQETAQVVDSAIQRIKERSAERSNDLSTMDLEGASRMDHSEEQRYMAIMKELQFGEICNYNNPYIPIII